MFTSPIEFADFKDSQKHIDTGPDIPEPIEGNALDSEENVHLHQVLMGYLEQELNRQSRNRMEMAEDADYYDSIQWTEEEIAILKSRGQEPLIYNVISTSVNYVIGTESRSRLDYKILPRRKEDSKPAERKTALLKYLSDVNATPFKRSRAFADAVKVGIGWIEDGAQDEDVDGEPVFTRYESWRNMLYDSASKELDLSDARYVVRMKYLDVDIAKSFFPQRSAVIEGAADDDSFLYMGELGDDASDFAEDDRNLESGNSRISLDLSRKRVKVFEMWFTKPERTKRIKGSDYRGEIYNEEYPTVGQQSAIEQGLAEVVERPTMRMYVAIFTSQGLLYLSPSPYVHNKYPFTPIWGYRRDRDNLPYGVIRNLKSIQHDINKRATRALHILSSNKIVMDKGAVENMTLDELADEVARPDAVFEVKQGARFDITNERGLASDNIEMMSRSIAMIQQQSGITDESMGRTTNATSGIAIARRQEQGSLAIANFFDNLRLAMQIQGEKQLSLVEQYFSDEKSFRITNIRGTPEYIVINDGLPDNDIVRTKADFIISESDWRSTIRQAQLEELFDIVGKLANVAPDVVLALLDLIVENTDIPNREEIVQRVRSITGQRDPDADEPTEEEIQQMQAQQMQQEMQMRMAQAELSNKEADALKKQAEANRITMDANKIAGQLSGQNVGTLKQALEAALHIINSPQAAPVADTILRESGFKSQSKQDIEREEIEAKEHTAQLEQEQQAMMEQEQALQQQALAEQEQLEQGVVGQFAGTDNQQTQQ